MNFLNSLDAATRARLEVAIDPPECPKMLQRYMHNVWGLLVPDRQVCSDCCSPLEAFWMSFTNRVPKALWLGPRGGGKSYQLTGLAVAKMVCYHIPGMIIGGTEEQSLNVIKALNGDPEQIARRQGDLWDSPNAPVEILGHKRKPGSNSQWTLTGGHLKAVPASMGHARGKHPVALYGDEIDAMRYNIYRSVLGAPAGLPEREYMGMDAVPAQITLCSTWQHADGTVSKVRDEMLDKGLPVFKWCADPMTQVQTSTGLKAIYTLQPGELVWTRQGWKPVQHVTCMGWKPTLRIHLNTGKILTLTREHKVLTRKGNWVQAGDLRPGLFLTGSTCRGPQTNAAVPSTVWPLQGILGAVGVAMGAMGPLHLGLDVRIQPNIFRQGTGLQVARVDARRIETEVVQGQRGIEGSFDHPITEAVGHAFPETPQIAPHLTVTSSIQSALPDPTPGLEIDHYSFHDVSGIYLNSKHVAASNLGTGHASSGTLPDFNSTVGTEVLFSHPGIVRITSGAFLPVFDIGVEDAHEFVAQGVIVHNCIHEVLKKNGGWMADSEYDRAKATMTKEDFEIEILMKAPSSRDQVFSEAQIDACMPIKLGVFDGNPDERITCIGPHPRLVFIHGCDWGRSRDWSVFSVLTENPEDPGRLYLAAWERHGGGGRVGWPLIKKLWALIRKHYRGFRGPEVASDFHYALHDATGMGGKMIDEDFFEVYGDPADPFDFSDHKNRRRIFQALIEAIQNQEILMPRIKWLKADLLRNTDSDLFRDGHPSDSFISLALAYEEWQRYRKAKNHGVKVSHIALTPNPGIMTLSELTRMGGQIGSLY